MECSEFRKLIPEFTAARLKYRQAAECLHHVQNCPACMDELEIYYIVEQGIKEETAITGPFILKDIIKDCIERVQRGIVMDRRRTYAFLALRVLIYGAVFAGVLLLMTYLL